MNAEQKRLKARDEGREAWSAWGPYLSERQWGTVREDYSPGGNAWDYFPHEQARSRAYRWGEDGLMGISDEAGDLCFAFAFWNGQDAILKERIFGLTNSEGNHGEDVKEYYFYTDNLPSHAWMSMLYRYPQRAFPYADLVATNRSRGKTDPEYELLDTGIFDEDRYFDLRVQYAKDDPDDIHIRLTVHNRGPDRAPLDVLPTLWFRNTWSWDGRQPEVRLEAAGGAIRSVSRRHGERTLYIEEEAELLFTDNETNQERLYGSPNATMYVKDGINDAVVDGIASAVNPARTGTRAAGRIHLELAPDETRVLRFRLAGPDLSSPFSGSDQVMAKRLDEADEFYEELSPELDPEGRMIQREALASLLWSKQFFYFDVSEWLDGDPAEPPPPDGHRYGRNSGWRNLHAEDVILMPDAWEYPWFAAWDWAFHCVTVALIDPTFAKNQLLLIAREWYMHPSGQLPAYEWAFSDVNPPVQAWAVWRVYRLEEEHTGEGDRVFLEKMFHKLLLNFSWWVNRKDRGGDNLFQGGFLGLDNIGIFDRSQPLPTGGYLEQADGTAWMAMYAMDMMTIARELARFDEVYVDIAIKFLEHFLYIVRAMNELGGHAGLWNEEDGFFYDMLELPNGEEIPLKTRSMVGLVPLYAVDAVDRKMMDELPKFEHQAAWFAENRPHLIEHIDNLLIRNEKGDLLLAAARPDRLRRILERLLDEEEFLGNYGIRALSRYHLEHPYELHSNGSTYRIDYEPAESSTGLFGGNSNWRGPIWMPVNFLLVEALREYYDYLGDDFKVECPTGSGEMMTLEEVADEISRRLISIFRRRPDGTRPVFGGAAKFQEDPSWNGHPLFYEYFHGDNGAGIGASHQTGWTALVAVLLHQAAGGARNLASSHGESDA